MKGARPCGCVVPAVVEAEVADVFVESLAKFFRLKRVRR